MFTYEISFWLRKESNVEDVEEKIINFFKELNFEILKKIPSKSKNTAYPIEKETSGYFGTIYFWGKPQSIKEFNEKVKSLPEVLRFVILKRKAIKIQPENNQQTESLTNKELSSLSSQNESQ